MRHFEELKEKYKDGWWEGHDGYTGDDMCSDIQYLIFVVGEYKEAFEKGYERGKQANVRIGELIAKSNQLEQENRDSQTIIDVYEEALQQIVDIGNKTYKTESEVIAEKVLKFYEE